RATSGRDILFRVDPAWGDEVPRAEAAPTGREPHPGPGPESLPRVPRLFQVVTLLGFVADQSTKALAFARVGGQPARAALPDLLSSDLTVKNFGALGGFSLGLPWEHEALTLMALAMTGVVARWALQSRGRWRPVEAVGWGLLLAGLLGNCVDRITLG